MSSANTSTFGEYDLYCPYAVSGRVQDPAQRPNFWRKRCRERYHQYDPNAPDNCSPCHPDKCLIPVKEFWEEIEHAVSLLPKQNGSEHQVD